MVGRRPTKIGSGGMSYDRSLENKLPAALVQNRSGKFIRPSLQYVSAAGEVEIPKNMRALEKLGVKMR